MLMNTISPEHEMTSYETLWSMADTTQKSVAKLFEVGGLLPSQVLEGLAATHEINNLRSVVCEYLKPLAGFSVSIRGDFQYPERIRDARYPTEVIYYRGAIDLMDSRCISVVGAREASADGINRSRRVVRELVREGFTIVSGLAAGIDTAAMTEAIELGGSTIGVIGTPINKVYPAENASLQERVAKEHLLISQVPFYRYAHESFNNRRFYFPQRNELMAALSEATIIVEASDTSGSLTQARAALQQGRKLFVLNSCFENKNISWPRKYELKGAIRVRSMNDIMDNIFTNKQDSNDVEEYGAD